MPQRSGNTTPLIDLVARANRANLLRDRAGAAVAGPRLECSASGRGSDSPVIYGAMAATIVVLLTLEAAAVILLFGGEVIAERYLRWYLLMSRWNVLRSMPAVLAAAETLPSWVPRASRR